MKIISVVLKGFERMALNNINLFSMHPTQMIQLILGSNGSGKSSLLGELTPLPADGSKYKKDGSKTIEILHRGHLYRLESAFPTRAGKHSFYKDGIPLQEGGTSSVQRELVKQEFGITPEIQDLISGKERFTTMSPSRRREWMTILSESNYDYAIGLFNRLKERSRDTTGALKRAKAELVAKRNALISPEEERKLQAEVDSLHRDLNILIENRAPLENSIDFYANRQERLVLELNEASKRLLKLKVIAPYGRNPLRPEERNEWGELERPYFANLAEVDEAINVLRHNVTQTETLLNKAVKDHQKHADAIAVMQKTGAEGIDALQTKLKEARDTIEVLLESRKLKLDGIDGHVAEQAFHSIEDSLLDIVTNIPINEDGRYSSRRMNELEEANLVLRKERDDLAKNLAVAVAKKNHMDAHKASGELHCPKCAHVWSSGYDPIRYATVMDEIGLLEAHIAKTDKTIQINQKEIEENRNYGNFYRSYFRITQAWPVLNPFWSYLLENEYIQKNPRFIMSVMETFRYDLQLEVKVTRTRELMAELIKFIAAAEQTGDTSIAEAQAHLEETHANIDEYTSINADLQKRIAEYTSYRKSLAEAIELGETIKKLRVEARDATEEMVEMIRRESIIQCTRQLQSALGRKEDALNHIHMQRGIIENLEQNIQKLEVEETVLKHMVTEMSPTEGMIAEGLLGFIRVFTKQMNGLIRKIWAYPLEILPCGTGGHDGAELDYKFPIMVKNKEGMRADVAEGSAGHKEIFDVVFKITAMEYLGLSEAPLFLDEFGVALDETHRVQAGQAVKQLMEQKQFTQMFMVSHYHQQYGSLTNAEVCVLCDTNITVPEKYNQHVVIA